MFIKSTLSSTALCSILRYVPIFWSATTIRLFSKFIDTYLPVSKIQWYIFTFPLEKLMWDLSRVANMGAVSTHFLIHGVVWYVLPLIITRQILSSMIPPSPLFIQIIPNISLNLSGLRIVLDSNNMKCPSIYPGTWILPIPLVAYPQPKNCFLLSLDPIQIQTEYPPLHILPISISCQNFMYIGGC